ncbi:hypothetical protein CCACVL1_20960 [Corchorus capsularis]|uniref:Uncharacterized protein n=1 Tax=Corchorus capsularis TaxID=210143 RepID=A0A1R3H952_COCAP|nr:hypothetical protein CCACVL1_20960 [Corchorus capsularis]
MELKSFRSRRHGLSNSNLTIIFPGNGKKRLDLA